MKPTFTIGIEEEYQTVDPVTRDLRSHIHAEIIEKGKLLLQERVKPEMHQSVVEIGTGVCRNIQEAQGRDHATSAAQMITLATENGLRLAAGGTHPFADWRAAGDLSRRALPRHRRGHADGGAREPDFRAARAHRHGGSRDGHPADEQARYFLPHILALSTNSPFWLGMDTGLKSYRCKVFDKFPRTNIPDLFTSWAEFENYVNLLIKHQLHRQRQEDLVGHPAASVLSDAGVPHLRHADARGRDHRASRR